MRSPASSSALPATNRPPPAPPPHDVPRDRGHSGPQGSVIASTSAADRRRYGRTMPRRRLGVALVLPEPVATEIDGLRRPPRRPAVRPLPAPLTPGPPR